MSLENFTTFTEVDPDNGIAVAENLITCANLDMQFRDVYVYKDYGEGNFSIDFTHKITIHVTEITSDPPGFSVSFYCWLLSNIIDEARGIEEEAGDYQSILIYWSGLDTGKGDILSIRLRICEDGVISQVKQSISTGIDYYLTVSRDDDGGGNGTGQLTLRICTGNYYGEVGAVELATLTRDCGVGKQNDFRYLYAACGYNTGGIDRLFSGTVANLDIATAPSKATTPPVILFTCSATTSVITAKLAPFPAALPIAETLEWNTHIIRGRDGSEQRITHRGGIPRQGFTYGLFCETEDRGVRLAAILHKWLKKQWFVPVWPEAEPITVALASGATTIPVDTRYSDYRAGGRAIVYENPDHAQVVRVSAVADDALTLSGGLASAYDGTTWISPCRLGYVTAAVPGEKYGSGAGIVQVTYEITDNIEITGHVAALTYDGLEVLTEPAKYFGDSWRETHDGDIQIVDAGIGGFKIAAGGDFNVTAQDHGWVNDSKARAWSFRQWLHAVAGRQKSFLVPTFRPDFVLTRTCQAADTSIYVANRGFASNLGVNAMATYLAFRPAGATIVPRKITGMAAISASEERIDILTAPGVGFAPGKELCWVHQCRLAKDKVPINWYERGENTCEMQLVRVSQ